MNTFHSTRSTDEMLTARQAIRRGLAADGGLYVSDAITEHRIDVASLVGAPYQRIAATVLGALLTSVTVIIVKSMMNTTSTPEVAYSVVFVTSIIIVLIAAGLIMRIRSIK